jgi:hypothetical protein
MKKSLVTCLLMDLGSWCFQGSSVQMYMADMLVDAMLSVRNDIVI